jgi:hypothetical protein
MWLERTGEKKSPQTVIRVARDNGIDQEFIEDSKNARVRSQEGNRDSSVEEQL